MNLRPFIVDNRRQMPHHVLALIHPNASRCRSTRKSTQRRIIRISGWITDVFQQQQNCPPSSHREYFIMVVFPLPTSSLRPPRLQSRPSMTSFEHPIIRSSSRDAATRPKSVAHVLEHDKRNGSRYLATLVYCIEVCRFYSTY